MCPLLIASDLDCAHCFNSPIFYVLSASWPVRTLPFASSSPLVLKQSKVIIGGFRKHHSHPFKVSFTEPGSVGESVWLTLTSTHQSFGLHVTLGWLLYRHLLFKDNYARGQLLALVFFIVCFNHNLRSMQETFRQTPSCRQIHHCCSTFPILQETTV